MKSRLRSIGRALLCDALIGSSLVLAAASAIAPAVQAQEAPRNVILLISDGCGPASITFAREYLRHKGEGPLALDGYLVGSISTYAADSRVTDSAASGTAMACGVKTRNGAIAVDTAGLPVATLLEAAEEAGMATGLVVTSTISHATPAVFSAHVASRGDQAEIVRQQLEQGIEVLFGGGEEYFLPEAEGGRRNDAANLFSVASDKGYTVARNVEAFQAVDTVPVLAIFGDGQMTFEIDRDPALEPSLSEMTRKALDLLNNSVDGFFLMIEGSRIDHAGHGNDAAAHLHEILEFDAAFGAAIEFAERNGETLVVATSDHETGGMSLGRNVGGRAVYSWSPEVVDRIDRSLLTLVRAAEERGVGLCDFLSQSYQLSCTEADSAAISGADSLGIWDAVAAVAEVISREAGVGWTTTGHTAVDVNVYAHGPGSESFHGHHDNIEIARRIEAVMGFQLDELTSRLRQRESG